MRFYRHRVDKAIAIICGYCNKSTSCDNCRFGLGVRNCPLADGTLPCDWDVDDMVRAHRSDDRTDSI